MASSFLDHETVEAVGILAQAVDQVRVPAVLEFRLLSNALRRVIDSREEQELNEAARVFQTLEPEFRARIVERAEAEAHTRASRAGAVTVEIPDVTVEIPAVKMEFPEPTPEPAAPRPALRAPGSSFLAALNGVRKAAPKEAALSADSRNAAKDRLKQAVESQRALPEDDWDSEYDTGLRPGERLPRSS